jgi:hypothetical protein
MAFGVSTQSPFHSSLLLIKELEKRSTFIAKQNYITFYYIQHRELIYLQQLEYFAELDSKFASLDSVLDYVVPETTGSVGNWLGHFSQWATIPTNYFTSNPTS